MTEQNKPLYHAHVSVTVNFEVNITDSIPEQEKWKDIELSERRLLQALVSSNPKILQQYIISHLTSEFMNISDRDWMQMLLGSEDITAEEILQPVIAKLEGARFSHWATSDDGIGEINTDNLDNCIDIELTGSSVAIQEPKQPQQARDGNRAARHHKTKKRGR